MTDLTTEYETEESYDRGSFNHGYLQARLVVLLGNIGNYTPVTELSLDISNLDLSKFDIKVKEEIRPDICLYPKRKIDLTHDILKMSEMPLLAIEILSPKQGIYDILEKFKIYFTLGIKSCWLVIPATATVTIYSPDDFKSFNSGEVVDETLNIHLPIAEIFS